MRWIDDPPWGLYSFLSAFALYVLALVGSEVSVALFPVFSVCATFFLAKAWRRATGLGPNAASGVLALLHGLGVLCVAFPYWGIQLAMVERYSALPDQPSTDNAIIYVLGQLLSGALFDILEVYQVPLAQVSPSVNPHLLLAMTMGMRLTGSAIIGAMLVSSVFRELPYRGIPLSKAISDAGISFTLAWVAWATVLPWLVSWRPTQFSSLAGTDGVGVGIFVLEHMLLGASFDVGEVLGIRISDVTYRSGEYTAHLVLGMRITGSLILGRLFAATLRK